MEFPEPWHSRDDWDHLEAAFERLNRLRRRKGLAPNYVSQRPECLWGHDGGRGKTLHAAEQQLELFQNDAAAANPIAKALRDTPGGI